MQHAPPTFTLDEVQPIRDHFRTHGFVAVRGILSEEECLETLEDVNRQMRRAEPAFDLFVTDTYGHAPVNPNYGVFSRTPIFSARFLNNRQHPNVHRAFALLYDDTDLLVSHDRCALYRPTRNVKVGGKTADRPEWKTEFTYPGVHLDCNPGVYHRPDKVLPAREALTYADLQDWVSENNAYCVADGLQIQAVLNLEDNRDEDGGFHCVPGFHHSFEDWLKGFPSADDSPGGLYRFSSASRNDTRFVTETVRVPAPAGSLILWEQRLAHGTRPNDSDRARCIQFLKMFPRRIVSRERSRARQRALAAIFRERGFNEVTAVGETVFGLGSQAAVQ
jgi:hypothetical protein